MLQSGIASDCSAGIFLTKDLDSISKLPKNDLRIVGRTIVNNKDFFLRIILVENATDSFDEEFAAIIGGHDDRDEGV